MHTLPVQPHQPQIRNRPRLPPIDFPSRPASRSVYLIDQDRTAATGRRNSIFCIGVQEFVQRLLQGFAGRGSFAAASRQ